MAAHHADRPRLIHFAAGEEPIQGLRNECHVAIVGRSDEHRQGVRGTSARWLERHQACDGNHGPGKRAPPDDEQCRTDRGPPGSPGNDVAVLSWSLKFALTGSILLANVVLHFVGWQTALQAAQEPATFLAMRISFAGGTVALALVAAWFIWRYSVTPEAVAAAQARGADTAPPASV